ncbi:UNVERIFIED_CONTAM: hypothetical protein GTU68_015376, partial [Idotea baltica]|nr:hypothetical protein [Idotea baltica]
MIKAGMDVVRLNFSHGTHEDHLKIYTIVREESEKAGKHVAIFQDLCGPKLRINTVVNGSIVLKDGESVDLAYEPKGSTVEGDEKRLNISIFNPGEVMKPGEPALLADGRVELVAEKVNGDTVTCKVVAGGALRSRVGIAVPQSNLVLPCLTEKDIKDLAWAVENKVDYVALSFVGTTKDITDIRHEMRKLGDRSIPVIAKIERASALDHINDIVELADAAMVARGDLGLELPIERVPSAQRLIISSANFAGVPVITATQMLMSMVEQIRPTRAEVTDVSTAVRDGTDAVMLSDETAIGKHPIEAVKVLSRILLEAERESVLEYTRSGIKSRDRSKVADAVCYAACNAADKIAASAMIACTHSGYTARLMAKYRP